MIVVEGTLTRVDSRDIKSDGSIICGALTKVGDWAFSDLDNVV